MYYETFLRDPSIVHDSEKWKRLVGRRYIYISDVVDVCHQVILWRQIKMVTIPASNIKREGVHRSFDSATEIAENMT